MATDFAEVGDEVSRPRETSAERGDVNERPETVSNDMPYVERGPFPLIGGELSKSAVRSVDLDASDKENGDATEGGSFSRGSSVFNVEADVHEENGVELGAAEYDREPEGSEEKVQEESVEDSNVEKDDGEEPKAADRYEDQEPFKDPRVCNDGPKVELHGVQMVNDDELKIGEMSDSSSCNKAAEKWHDLAPLQPKFNKKGQLQLPPGERSLTNEEMLLKIQQEELENGVDNRSGPSVQMLIQWATNKSKKKKTNSMFIREYRSESKSKVVQPRNVVPIQEAAAKDILLEEKDGH